MPIVSYIAQVVLFYFVSLLNNAAFAYNIPMAVHIIFRSGGLIISLILGWLVSKKRQVRTQSSQGFSFDISSADIREHKCCLSFWSQLV